MLKKRICTLLSAIFMKNEKVLSQKEPICTSTGDFAFNYYQS